MTTDKTSKYGTGYVIMFTNDIWFMRPGGCFTGDRLSYMIIKNIVCRSRHKAVNGK